MAKLILEKRVRKTKGHLVRIDPAVLDRIDGVSLETGLSYRELVDLFCTFAMDNLEIVERKDEGEGEDE